MSLGVIGGSGLEAFEGLEGPRKLHAETPWGPPSSALVHARLDGHPVVFLSRHGESHAIAPHEINYRANLHALREAGVTGILAVATVGGLRADLGPGALVLPDQLIDYTSGRVSTFFQGPGVPVTHVDFTHPYDARLRALVQQAAIDLGETVSAGGTYGCTQGPRLETAAEIRRMRQDGCDLVGMTGMPEAVLARELGIPYAALAVVANHAAGIGGSAESISLEAIVQVVQAAMVRVRALIARTVTLASGA